MALEKSPLAPERFPDLPAVGGVQIAGRACGLKRSGAKDLMLATLAPGTTVAGVFTRSLCSSAPVDWCRAALPGGRARAIVCNSGNANAFTGKAGDTTAERTAKAAAALFGCAEQEVFLASTGVIGVPVRPDHIGDCLPGLARHLSAGAWQDAAEAIMTTDTFPKGAGTQTAIGGTPVSIAGFAKGSGMIAPDMATMLGFVFTDADIPAPLLQKLLARSNDRSFNAITVDGDTSTSDTVLLCATGAAGNAPPADLRAVRDFERALDSVMIDLAQQIVRDGEGASKFVTVNVSGAVSARAARRIGLTIANSPLVKTAIAGEDANWGRIVMAVGKAGEKADRDRLSIAIGGVTITENGQLVPGYDETPVAGHMQGAEIDIDVDIGIGRGRATVWTCDLTHGYISINADYRS
ncbi:MAG: bifunctional glutamate N-acetyltransferase/amino-acid acetyltransferase ArgJ [Rhodospirillaceae bacterium]|nr:bifunctional glutamate N-acetyltransferase/amino-acid acetyltransferase ArgJ [Rhodospirillaceae bacterium]